MCASASWRGGSFETVAFGAAGLDSWTGLGGRSRGERETARGCAGLGGYGQGRAPGRVRLVVGASDGIAAGRQALAGHPAALSSVCHSVRQMGSVRQLWAATGG